MNMPSWRISGSGSFKRQIIVAFVGGFLLLIGVFTAYLVAAERTTLYRNSAESTIGLAESLAVSSRSWVLANDVAGLQEVVHAFQDYPQLRYAMVISPAGRVLAHSDVTKVGEFLVDESSLAFLKAPAASRVIADNEFIIDVVVPIKIDERQIGWARIGLAREGIARDLRRLILGNMVFILISVLLALLAAVLVASRLGERIDSLVEVAEKVQRGNFSERADVSGRQDEITRLAHSLNQMLDTLAQNDKALRTASRYTRSLIEASLDPLVTISVEGKITDVNEATEKTTGRSRDELIGSDFSKYFTQPDKAREGYQQVFQNGFVTNYPLALRHKDGHIRDVLYNASVYRDETGEVLGVFAAARDITERKQAEEDLKRMNERFNLASHAARLGVWDWDIRKNELLWDDAMYALYGIKREDFAGAYEAWLQGVHPDDRARCDESSKQAQCGERDYDTEFRVVWPDGSIHTLKAYGQVVRDADDNPMRMTGINFDITERKRAEEELKHYKDHLEDEVRQRTADLMLARNAAEAANRAKSVFLANMSHELRTPLNAILGFSSIMRKDTQLPESLRQNLDIINRSGEHLLTLINDVLEMAKIEAGRVQLENAPFDLGGMVRDVIDMMHMRAKEKGLQLLIDQSSHFPRYIVGDEARLRQVIINLMGNAIKFTQQGGVTLRLGTRQNKISHLQIEVEDSGSGISPADQQRVFDPFVQLGEQGINKGTGLGLTITRQFIQLMGGSISLESTPGKGSLFRVDLPLNEVAEADIIKPAAAEQGEVVGLAPGQPASRILIVEDQRDNQLLLSTLMESVGFKVRIAENGEQGIQLFQSWHPHFIWMDRRMPVMDGLEATQRIRKLPGGKDVKIVAVTASAFVEQRAEMLTAGMDDFVRKPYRPNEIYDCLSRQLGVKFLYEGAAEPAEAAVSLTPEMLAVLPQELRNNLKDALESLKSGRIALVIQQVAAHDPALQKTLSRLADNFDYPAILRALSQN